jgi:undecaprenyl-diphosphatase
VTLIPAALLGLVQGLTEFLPVSSSAHLILARAFFGWNGDQFGLPFDVACHLGTLMAAIAYFRHEVLAMTRAVPQTLRTPFSRAEGPVRQTWLLVAGTLPVAVVGVLFGDAIERTMRTPGVAATALAAGALALLAADRVGSRSRREDSLTVPEALALGLAQSAALIPGVSRSGATMVVAIWFGLRRDAAARFAFLLGIPAILAASAREGFVLMGQGLTPDLASLFLVGVVCSGGIGYLTVKYFLRYLADHSLDLFAFYRLTLAAGTGLWAVGL